VNVLLLDDLFTALGYHCRRLHGPHPILNKPSALRRSYLTKLSLAVTNDNFYYGLHSNARKWAPIVIYQCPG